MNQIGSDSENTLIIYSNWRRAA